MPAYNVVCTCTGRGWCDVHNAIRIGGRRKSCPREADYLRYCAWLERTHPGEPVPSYAVWYREATR